MKLRAATSSLDTLVLPSSERQAVGDWLSFKLQSCQAKISKAKSLPSQTAVDSLLRSGLSPLKRRYFKTKLSAHAVAWGWLGWQHLLGKIDPTIERMRQGGTPQQGWSLSAMLEGGWVADSNSCTATELQRMERIISCLPRCPGATYDSSSKGGTYILGPHSLTLLHEMLRRHYTASSGGVDLLAVDVAVLVLKGQLTGDCLRYQCGGHLDIHWWGRVTRAIIKDGLAVSRSTINLLDSAVKVWYSVKSCAASVVSARPAITCKKVYWVLDICCGFRSLDKPVDAAGACFIDRGGSLRCIGIDIVPCQVRHTETIFPDWCVDLLDDQLLPRGKIVSSICQYFGLNLHLLLHVHASPPCDTNSRADASNLNRGCGYRDWHSPHCLPLPASCTNPPPSGYTTESHRRLAVQHDALERKLLHSLIKESTAYRFSYTVENPVGEFSLLFLLSLHIQVQWLAKNMFNYYLPPPSCTGRQLTTVISLHLVS